MARYLVERSLKGIPMEALAAAQKRAIDTAADMSKDGAKVSYIRSAFVPEDGRCMCMFEAENAEQVKTLNQKAEIPFNTVTPVLDLVP